MPELNIVEDNYVIKLSLDGEVSVKYRNPLELGRYIRSLIIDKDKDYFIFLDEIQHGKEIKNSYLEDPNEKICFVDVLLGLMEIKPGKSIIPMAVYEE